MAVAEGNRKSDDQILDEIMAQPDIAPDASSQRPQATQPLSEEEENLVDAILGEGTATSFTEEELGEPGLDDLALRFSMSRGGNLQEKLIAFKKKYPQGDLRMERLEPAQPPVLLFKKNPDEPYKKVDPGMFEKREIVNDIAEFLGEEMGPIIGETLALYRSKGLSLIKLAKRLFTGTTGGQIAAEGLQTLQGEQRETTKEVITKAAKKGVLAGVTGGAVEGVRRVAVAVTSPAIQRARAALSSAKNQPVGVGLIGAEPGAKKALRASARLGVNPPPLTGLTDIPILQRLGGLGGATLPTINRYARDVQQQNLRVFNKLRQVPRDLKRSLPEDLDLLNRQAKRKLLSRAVKDLKDKNIKLLRPTDRNVKETAQAVLDYDDISNTAVTTAYRVARGIERPQFNKTLVMDDVELLTQGIWRPRDSKHAIRVELHPNIKKIINDISESADDIPDVLVQQGDKEVTLSGTETIRFWMRELGHVAFDDGAEPTQKAIATQLRVKLKKILFNPENTNPQFKEAWQKANQIAQDRFDTVSHYLFTSLQKTDNPSKWIRKFIASGSMEDAQFLKKVMGGEFAKIKGFFFADMLDDPVKMANRLDSMPKEFVRELATPKEIASLRKLSEQYAAIRQVGIDQITNRQVTKRAIIDKLIFQNDTASIATLTNMVKQAGGVNSEFGKQMRGAILDYIYHRSTSEVKGVAVIDEKVLKGMIQKLKDSGAARMVTLSDVRNLIDIARVQEVVGPLADPGVSIAATQTASGARGLQLKALQHIAENGLVSTLSTNPTAIKIIIGKGLTTPERRAMYSNVYAAISSLVAVHSSPETARKEEQFIQRLEDASSL